MQLPRATATVLNAVWQSDEQLLRLYEGGLPVWAIYAPKWGFPYRPWLRTLTWLLFMAVSVFSLLTGFYDLYRHMPFLDQVSPQACGPDDCSGNGIDRKPTACASSASRTKSCRLNAAQPLISS